ncbi:ATPase [Acetivibrio cellulolyticus]|uniref:ATPase n=1 Tax=Acetivibrio cellulolyticus TaxID=35830 RepID=UPI0001E2C6EA|nr:ATPase [Acetivibrio cellulolyticus]
MEENSIQTYHEKLRKIKSKHEEARIHFYNQKGKKEQLVEQKSSLEKLLQKAVDNIDILEKVKVLLQKVSEFAREQSRAHIEALVTNCLQYIFDSSLEFRIEISEVRGRPEAEFYVLSKYGDMEIKTKPQDARGGGVIDIISLAIRIAMLECSNLDNKGPIILDEPAKHVSDDYINQVAEFLKQVTHMFNRQVIMVTHNRHLSEMADKWYRIEMHDGVSIVSQSGIN